MKVTITRGKDVLASSVKSEEVITRPVPTATKTGGLKAEVVTIPAPTRNNNRFRAASRSKVPMLNVSVTKGDTTLIETVDKKKASKTEIKKTTKPSKKPAKTNVKIVSVDEVTEDKENDKVNIKITVEADPVEEEKVEATEDAEVEKVDTEETEIDEDPVDEIDEKYADLYDDEDNFSRKQPVRTKTTKKISDGDEAPKKKTTTRIPKK